MSDKTNLPGGQVFEMDYFKSGDILYPVHNQWFKNNFENSDAVDHFEVIKDYRPFTFCRLFCRKPSGDIVYTHNIGVNKYHLYTGELKYRSADAAEEPIVEDAAAFVDD